MCVQLQSLHCVTLRELGCFPPTVLYSAVLGLEGKLLQDRHINFLTPEKNLPKSSCTLASAAGDQIVA